MTVYLYTENFENSVYRLYEYSGGRLRRLSDEQNNKYLDIASRRECGKALDDGGISVSGECGMRFYLSFSILINELAPSGRRRLLFGFTKPEFIPNDDFGWIEAAIREFCDVSHISIPRERLKMLLDALSEKHYEIRQESYKRVIRIIAAIFTLGISALVDYLMQKKKDEKNGKDFK